MHIYIYIPDPLFGKRQRHKGSGCYCLVLVFMRQRCLPHAYRSDSAFRICEVPIFTQLFNPQMPTWELSPLSKELILKAQCVTVCVILSFNLKRTYSFAYFSLSSERTTILSSFSKKSPIRFDLNDRMQILNSRINLFNNSNSPTMLCSSLFFFTFSSSSSLLCSLLLLRYSWDWIWSGNTKRKREGRREEEWCESSRKWSLQFLMV